MNEAPLPQNGVRTKSIWNHIIYILQKIEVLLLAYLGGMKPDTQFYALADRYQSPVREFDSHRRALTDRALTDGQYPEALKAQRSEDVNLQLSRKRCQ